MAEVLKDKAAGGIIWSFLDKFGQQFIYLISGILLARILTPYDYGLVGALAIFTLIANALIDSGFSRGLINKKNISQTDCNSVFYFNLGASLFLYLLLFLLAPFIAVFFHQPKLQLLSRVIFLAIPFNALGAIQSVIVWRNLNFKLETKANLIALSAASCVAVGMVYTGFGVWSLVVQTLLLAFLRSICLWVMNTWHPTFAFDFAVLKELSAFGGKVLLIKIITIIFNNIYSVIIGRVYNATQLGYYTQANKYQDIPSTIIGNTFRSVSIPLFTEVVEEQRRMKRVLEKLIKGTAYFSFPVFACLILMAKPLFVVLITEKWLPSVVLFQILCIGGLLNNFSAIFGEAILSKGLSGLYLRVEMLKKFLLVLFIVIFIHQGVVGLAISWACYNVVNILISVYYMRRLFAYFPVDFIRNISSSFLLTLAISVPLYFLNGLITNYYLMIVLNVMVMGFFYLALSVLLKFEIAEEVKGWIRKRVNKN